MAAIRKQAGKTQQQVADATGIDRSVVNALEKGRRAITSTYADRIAPVLGVTSADLLPPAEARGEDPDDPLVRLARLEETAIRSEDLAPILRVIELLAKGRRSEALRVLSEEAAK